MQKLLCPAALAAHYSPSNPTSGRVAEHRDWTEKKDITHEVIRSDFVEEEQTHRRNVPVRETQHFRTASYRYPFLLDYNDGPIHGPATLFFLRHFRMSARRLNSGWKAAIAEAGSLPLTTFQPALSDAS